MKKIIGKMISDKTTLDEEKENTCNGNGINEKLIIKLPTPEFPNGILRNDTESIGSLDVGDFPVEDSKPSRNDNEENSFQNGSKSDDSSSVSSNCSNFSTADFQQDDLSDEDLILRLSDEDEPINTVPETDNLYFSSSPLSKSEEDNFKTEENVTSAVEGNANSEINKDTKSVNEEDCKNQDKDTVVQESNNKVGIKELNNTEFDNQVSEIRENSDENNCSLDKSDDNLENLISNLNEKKSTLKSERKLFTMSEIRKEIEDFINKNVDDDVDSGATGSKAVESENNKTKSVEPEKNSISNDKIMEPDNTKKEIKENLYFPDFQDLGNVEEIRTSLKRVLQNEENSQDTKKIKINGLKHKDESEKQYVRLDIFRDFMSKKEISTLTRAELEQFCLQKICEAVTQTSKIGQLNRKILQHETSIEAMRTKCTSLSKQMRDLEVVHSKVLQEVRAKAKEGNCDVIPVKITRTVGVQVSLPPLTGRKRPQIIATSEPTPKVIDLNDEDIIHRPSGSVPAGNIRVVPPQQLQNTTSTPVMSASLPRLTTYLMQGNQQDQQILLPTSSAPTRPRQVRSTLMFKPIAPGQIPPSQRFNIVRSNTVPKITVLPSTTSSAICPTQQTRFATPVAGSRLQIRPVPPAKHPAPLPGPPAVQLSHPNWKTMPPKPALKISKDGDRIVLSWRMHNKKDMSLYEEIESYQIYAYQETSGPPSVDIWRKVGDVKALALPMACTLTQFTDGNKYHFAVRAVDMNSRIGPFSQPKQIL